MCSERRKSQDSGQSTPRALWPVDLKLTHLDWNPEETLIHFQAQYLTICDLDYNILQVEVQNTTKTKAAVDVGECCLVEDFISGRWYRGRVQNRNKDMFDVFLIDYGNVMSVDISHLSSCSNDLLILPPKIVCGFFANVLPLRDCWDSVVEKYFSSLLGKSFTGYIQALLPHKVVILEAPDINKDLIRLGFGKRVDTDTFLLLVEMLTEVPLKQNIEAVPDLLIDKPRGQEFCFKPSRMQGLEDIISLYRPKMSAGTRIKVRVTTAVNPGLFFCQMTSMTTDLQAMSEKLATICESRSEDPSQKPQENLGILCSVKGRDEKWHRGFVQFLPVNSQVRVLFVDYGFCEFVRVENVHRLPPDFLSMPVMAFPCSLSSVTDKDETVKMKQLSFLKKGLLGRVLNAEIICFDEEQNLYSITVLSAEDDYMSELGPIHELPKMKIETMSESEQMLPQGGYLCCETVMAQALANSVQAEEIQVDSVFVGYVEHALNPSQFWMRTQKRNSDFEDMMEQMADHFNRVKLDEEVLENLDLGTLCCAMYEKDMNFYRAVVTDTLEHGAQVLFIDFGNTEKVPHMLIKKIPERFASKPAFALSCALVNVIPVDDVWTNTNTDLFRRAVSNRALLVHVVHLRKDKVVVDLYEMRSDHTQSITELLISSNQAEFWKYTPSEPVMQHKKLVAKKTNKQGPKLRCTPHITLCGNRVQWQNYKQRNEKEVKTEILQEKNTQNKNEIPKAQASASYKILHFKPGCEFAVHCCHISCPSDFWCQLPHKLPTLEELMDKIQKYYTTHKVTMQVGDSCCVAKSPEDGRWYRAWIVAEQKGHVEVMFVDYGVTVQIKEHNIQKILPEYQELEGQAFRCSLDTLIETVNPKSYREWSKGACTSLRDFVQNNTANLRCSVISHLNIKNKGLCNVVDLYNTQTKQSITKVLIEMGLAREMKISAKILSSVCPESYTYSSFNLSNGCEEQVHITHLSSPWELYCQLDRDSEIIEELEKKVAVESEKIMQANRRAVLGKLCLAKYFDGKWYRGLARPVQSPLHLSVFFVDYGNTNIIEKTNVVSIPRESADLLYTPMQAVRCSLTQVPKKELNPEVKQWLEETILNKQVRAIIGGKSEDGSFVIDLFDGDIHINEKVKELIASLTPSPNKVVNVDIDSTKTKYKTLYTKHIETPRKCYNNNSHSCIRTARRKSKVNKKNSVPRKAKEFAMGKQQMEQHDTNSISEKPPHTGEMSQLSSLPNNKVKAGFKALCYVSHIDTVNSFFLHMQEDEPDILKMVEDLNSNLCRDSLMKTTLVGLRTNNLVLAEYEEDGSLYRAVVKGYEAGGCFKVEFLDYGNSAVVEREKTYSMTEECLSKPRLSIPCSLLEKGTYETDASFSDAVMEKPLMVDFVSQFDTQWKVKIDIHNVNTALSDAPEAAAEKSNVIEKGGESPTSSFEIEKTHAPPEQSCFTIKEEELQQRPERVTHTTKCKNVDLMLLRKRLSTKHTLKRLHYQSKKPSRNMKDSCKCPGKPVKTSKSSVELMGGIKAPIVQARETANGTLLSVLDNGDFYVRLDKTTDLFAALESLIAKKLNKCTMVVEEDVKEGLRCLVKDDNSQWHRAVVQHVDQDKCQVFLVDHGITKENTIGCLRELCFDLAQIPSTAVLCRLNNHHFATGENAHGTWQETLRLMVGKNVKLMFVSFKANNIWMVEIVVNGLFLIQQINTTSQERTEEMTPPLMATQNVMVTAEREPSLESNPPPQLSFAPVHMGRAYFGFPAAVTTPSEFCVILEDLFLIMNTVSIMLDDLPGEMSPLPETHLIPGSCCLLRSDTKNKWCRAQVMHIDKTVVTYLVDHGHCMDVAFEERTKLKRLPEALTRLPKLTYPCTLRGVKPVPAEGPWTDDAVVFFQECLYQKNLQIFFREFVSDAHWEVDILADGVHIAKELVDAGHASYIDVMLGLR
ncbi:tudor domain-containing protein 15 [Polymixia lowei]